MNKTLARVVTWFVRRPAVVGILTLMLIIAGVWVPYISRQFPVITDLHIESVDARAVYDDGYQRARVRWTTSFCRHRPDAILVNVAFSWVFADSVRGAGVRFYGVRNETRGRIVGLDGEYETYMPQCNPPLLITYATDMPPNGRTGDHIQMTVTYRPLWGWAWWTHQYDFGRIPVPSITL